jgi:cyclophilin family peptidyl-prolyl cis-trans isomerase
MRTLTEQKHEDLLAEFSGAEIKTNLGVIKVKFYSESPITANNFLNLAKQGFYDNTKFHRIIKDFMIQGGDPLTKDDVRQDFWGTGGPDYRFQDEFNRHPLVRGNLAMANSGANTNGSQFFIVTAASTPWLDGRHTNFGEVVQGMDVVEKIEAVSTGASDRPLTSVIIESISLLK